MDPEKKECIDGVRTRGGRKRYYSRRDPVKQTSTMMREYQ